MYFDFLYCTENVSENYCGCCPLPRPKPPLCNRKIVKTSVNLSSMKFKLHQFKLTCQFLCNGNLKPQPQANKKFTKKCCVMVVFTIETQIHVLKEKSILTNWNSVAAPAPASAFLSAPANEETKNEQGSNTQEMFITTGFVLIVTYGVQQIACRYLCQPPHG